MSYWSFEELLFLSFIAKKVCTACSSTSYKIVPLTNLNKYLHNDTSETAVSIDMKNGLHKETILFSYISNVLQNWVLECKLLS